MRVSRELQGDACFGRERQAVRVVNEQDTGSVSINRGLAQNRAEFPHIRSVTIVNAYNLQSVYDDFFVLENANSRLRSRQSAASISMRI